MCALVIVLEAYSDDLIAHLDERFIFDSEEEGLLVYRNGNDEDDTTMLIGVFMGNGDSLMILYMEYVETQTEAKPMQSVSRTLKNLRHQL